jgi:hypothetical protein
MAMSGPDAWVSIRAVAWVIDEAPVPAELAFTLIVIARRCDENGKGSYQSVKTIAEKAGKSEDQAARDIKRLRKLGLILLGDQTLPEKHGIPKGRRPVVYDLPLELKGPKPAKASKNKTGRKKQATPRMDAAQTTLNNPGTKTSINPRGPELDTDRPSSARASGTIDKQPHQTKITPPTRATQLADDISGRRWLTENLFLADEEAAQVVAVVRHRHPDITHMARYLGRMHRAPDGTLKPELLDIVEAVQTAAPPHADEPELELQPPRTAPSTSCPHEVPNADRNGCPICDQTKAVQQHPQPAAPADMQTGRDGSDGGEEPSTVASAAQDAIRDARRNLDRSRINGPKTTARKAS